MRYSIIYAVNAVRVVASEPYPRSRSTVELMGHVTSKNHHAVASRPSLVLDCGVDLELELKYPAVARRKYSMNLQRSISSTHKQKPRGISQDMALASATINITEHFASMKMLSDASLTVESCVVLASRVWVARNQ